MVSTQKYRAVSNIIRVNATNLYVFRLRNAGDLEAWIDEVSAITDKKTLYNYIKWQQQNHFHFYSLS